MNTNVSTNNTSRNRQLGATSAVSPKIRWWENYDKPLAKDRSNKRNKFITILRFDYDGNFVDKKYINKETCIEFGYNHETVLAVSLPSSKVPSYKGYIWIREENYSKEELDRKLRLRQSKPTQDKRGLSTSKKIIQIDIESKKIIRIWPSVTSVEDEGYDTICVIAVLKNRRKTYLDCIWVYYDKAIDYNDVYISNLVDKNISKIANRCKKVKQISTTTGEVIEEYSSIGEASRETGIPETTLRRMIKGKKTIYTEYIWELCQ